VPRSTGRRSAAAGYKFAFVKATEGGYYANPYYASDLAQAKAAGLYAAGYHFAVPNVSDGTSQADYRSATAATPPTGARCRLPSTLSTTRTAPSATG
jgi:GH25 family lysozyme M1 (1,4-beta-N-acetylmuramidase)